MYQLSVFVHILSAIVLVSGMLFVALIAVPAIRHLPAAERAGLLGRLGRRFRLVGWVAKKGRRSGRLLCPALALGAAFPWVYFLILRPWYRGWGATDEEVRMPLPGDELVPEPGYRHTRVLTIRAPAEEVWKWLAQIGQGRGGFYRYDWLENLAGCDIHSAGRIHPEWQDLRPGDTLAVLRGWGPKIAAVEPGRALVIEGWGTYAVRPLDAYTSRLIARARQPRRWPARAYLLMLESPHFIMERKMLLGIKERAEREAAVTAGAPAHRLAGG
jgi:hypothetical protein